MIREAVILSLLVVRVCVLFFAAVCVIAMLDGPEPLKAACAGALSLGIDHICALLIKEYLNAHDGSQR